MRVVVVYQVPVLVEVDTTSGLVESVIVDDEAVSGPLDVMLGVGGDDERRRAFEIAEEADWPAWQLGN